METAYMRIGLTVAAMLCCGLPARAEVSGAVIAEQFAIPALTALEGVATAADAQIGELCAAPSTEALDAARFGFGGLVAAWGRVSVLRFGPLASDSRFEKLFFWPDPRGIALRQVQGLLAEADMAALADGVGGKSAALQGIPALEFVLFGTEAESLATPEGAFRCTFAQALARNIAGLASEVRSGWSEGGFVDSFRQPAPGGEPYRSAAEVDGEIIKAFSTVFQYVRAAELLPAMGETIEKANGRRAPLWRSRLTFDLMLAQTEGAQALLATAGYAENLPADSRYIADSIRFELANAARMLAAIEQPPKVAFGNEADRQRLTIVDLSLDHAGHLVAENLSAALGLTMGFNALDGD